MMGRHGVEDDGKAFVFIERENLEGVLAEHGLPEEKVKLILGSLENHKLVYDALHGTYSPYNIERGKR